MTSFKKILLLVLAIALPAMSNAQSYFTLGSSVEEVRKVQGKPDEVDRYEYSGYERWEYGRSSVRISTRTREVIEWDNKGNLRVILQPGYNVTDSNMFTQGSHKDDVIRLQGTPDEINRYPYSGYIKWDYGRSSVRISTRTNRVLEWDNKGNLKVGMKVGSRTTLSKTFTQGSHKDDVLRLQGAPDEINRYTYSGYESWEYGRSSVRISTQTNQVLEWDNKGNLKVGMKPGSKVTESKVVSIGSHKDDVLRLHGTPGDINRYAAMGYERWEYGRSSFKISLATHKVVEYSNKGELRAARMANDSVEREIKYHHKFDDVTLYYDENKSFSNIISYETDGGEKIYGVIDNGITYFYDSKLEPLNMYAYYDEEKDLNVKPIDSSVDEYSIDGMRSRLRNIDFSGDISGTGTATRHGNMTFYDIMTDNGSYIHGSSIDMGRISFDDFYTSEGVSYSGSRMRIGRFSFGDWSSFDGPDISGTSTRIGRFIFHDYTTSDGRTVTGTTTEIGDFSFTDFNEY